MSSLDELIEYLSDPQKDHSSKNDTSLLDNLFDPQFLSDASAKIDVAIKDELVCLFTFNIFIQPFTNYSAISRNQFLLISKLLILTHIHVNLNQHRKNSPFSIKFNKMESSNLPLMSFGLFVEDFKKLNPFTISMNLPQLFLL